MQRDAQHRAISAHQGHTRSVLVIVGVTLGAAACASGPRELPSALAAAPPPRQVAYSLHIEPGGATAKVAVRRPASCPFVFEVPETWSDGVPSAVGSDGAELPVAVSADTWSVGCRGQASFQLSMPIAGSSEPLRVPRNGPLPPYAGSKSFLALGSSLFPVPAEGSGVESLRGEVVTEGGRWPVWTTWGRVDSGLSVPSDISRTVFVAGDWKVSARDRGGLLQVAVSADMDVSPSHLRELLAKTLALQAETLGRSPDNSLLLVVVDGEHGPAAGRVSGDSVTVGLADGATDAQVVEILARALFRRALRQVTQQIGDPQASWFARGVERYYALRAAIGLGYLDDEGVLARLNDAIGRYYAGPAEIANADRDELLVLILDVNLRADSGGLKSLDLFVRRLLFDLDADPSTLGPDDLQRRLEAFSGRSWQPFFEQTVHGSSRLPLGMLDRSGLIMSSRQTTAYGLGFTYGGDSLQDALVTSVSADGPAAKAGLRVGDVVKAIKMSRSTTSEIHIEVQRQGVDEPVIADYMPEEKISVPRVTEITDLFRDWFMP